MGKRISVVKKHRFNLSKILNGLIRMELLSTMLYFRI